MKSADLIGHKFLSWRQLDDCSVTRPFLSLRRVWFARLASVVVIRARTFFFLKFWSHFPLKCFETSFSIHSLGLIHSNSQTDDDPLNSIKIDCVACHQTICKYTALLFGDI